MKRITFAACLFLGLISLIGRGADAKDSSDGSIDSYQDSLSPEHFSLCKEECKADVDKIKACLKSDGGKLGELRLELQEKCKCDSKCHKEAREAMNKKESKNKKEPKSKEELKSKEEKANEEAFAKLMNCLHKAGVRNACLPTKSGKRPVRG
jgi:hypothetical protein